MKRKRAFTLIELLVVSAIIAILASLLLPALARSKESARAVLCINNQKQLYLAWNLYGDDNEKFPSNYDYGGVVTSSNWTAGGMSYETSVQARPLSDATNTLILRDQTQTLLARYLQTAAVFKCPADKSYAIRDGIKYPRARSYSMNSYVGAINRPVQFSLKAFNKWEDFSSVGPASIFIYLDEHEDSINDGFFLVGTKDDISYGWEDVPATRHSNGNILGFGDGHVEKHRWQDARTKEPITRKRLFGVPQPGNKDVQWIHAHASGPSS